MPTAAHPNPLHTYQDEEDAACAVRADRPMAEPEAAGAVDVAVCEACDGSNTVIVDYDRGIYAPCGTCHPVELYEAFGAANARADRLAMEMERLACEWVESAFRQTDLHSIPGDASAGVLRLCAEQLRERIRAAVAGDAPGRGEG